MRSVISRVTPVLCLFGLLVTMSPTTSHAQGGPTSAIDIPMSDIETVLAVENGGTDRQIRIVDFSRELSRLFRTDKDFCHLMEVCGLFDTVARKESATPRPTSRRVPCRIRRAPFARNA